MTIRAKLTSSLSRPLPKKRCLISSDIHAEIEFKLDEIVDCAAAKLRQSIDHLQRWHFS